MSFRTTYDFRELGNRKLGLWEIRKYWEYHKNGRRQSLVPSFPSPNKNLVLVVKNYAKLDFKVFLSCPILLDVS